MKIKRIILIIPALFILLTVYAYYLGTSAGYFLMKYLDNKTKIT